MSVKFLTGQGVDGDVGIGTNSPTAKLDVRTANGNTQSLRIGRIDAASYWDFNHAGNDLRIYNNGGTGQDILLGVNAAGTIYDNKVGIGTATPSSKLEVAGGNTSTAATALFSIQKNEEGYGLFSGILGSGTSWLQSSTKTESAYYALSLQPNGGNVGIGTTSPGYKLHVNGGGLQTTTATLNRISYYDGSGIGAYSSTGWNIGNYIGDLSLTNNADNKDIIFKASAGTAAPAEIMRIDGSAGNVGIGTTNPATKLDVRGDITITNANGSNPTDAGSLYFTEAAGVWGITQYGFRINQQGTSNYLNFQSANTTTVRDILTLARDTGNVGIGTTSPSFKLEVTGNAKVSSNFYIGNVDPVTTATEVLVRQSDRVRGITPANLIDSISAPVTPGSITSTIVGETIEISFNESTTSNIDYYQVWSSDDGGDFGIIAQITPTDFSSTMTVVDTTFVTGGTMSYRVYAVKTGIYSSPGTTSTSYTVGVLNVTNMSVVNLNTAYYIQYEKPLSRFIDHIEIYMDSQTTQGALNRSNASIVYSGQNPSYMRDIGVSSNFHQFWVEVVTT
ncbi:hypothetical protein N9H34_02030 [bacterium]|nr:hypothetical protein [bacterium]MDA9247048.1 hypothetical protein [Flavobacteriaceae bacterium]MDB4277653.1 hypothetical protein [Gammaproteobacteria bacterium]